jgi:hypothetical protein
MVTDGGRCAAWLYRLVACVLVLQSAYISTDFAPDDFRRAFWIGRSNSTNMDDIKSRFGEVLLLVFYVTLSTLGCGCSSLVTVFNGVDSLIPRKVKDLNSGYRVTLAYANNAPIKLELPLELYYDTQPSARGNFWSVRFVGQRDSNGEISVAVRDPELRNVTFLLGPDLLRRLAEKRGVVVSPITINGVEYQHAQSEGGFHFYKSSVDAAPVRMAYSLAVGYL